MSSYRVDSPARRRRARVGFVRSIVAALIVGGTLVLALRDAAAQEPPPPPPAGEVDVTAFQEPLSMYGQWMELDPYGAVWMPAGVGPDWRPYTIGHWIFTDYGWTWVSDEPWGWASYHYGRWSYDAGLGWFWVPGTIWGPSWVAWRWGGGYVGWAPLSPVVGYEVDFIGMAIAVATGWVWCGERDVFEPHVHRHFVPQRPGLWERTRDLTRYDRDGDHIVSRGIDPGEYSHVTGVPVEHHRVVDITDRAAHGMVGHDFRVYRPFRPSSEVVERAFVPGLMSRVRTDQHDAGIPRGDGAVRPGHGDATREGRPRESPLMVPRGMPGHVVPARPAQVTPRPAVPAVPASPAVTPAPPRSSASTPATPAKPAAAPAKPAPSKGGKNEEHDRGEHRDHDRDHHRER
jgi:hypothetical protein